MARMNVRQMWKAKLEGRTVPASGPAVVSLQRPPFAGRVLGIDPSLRGTGLALVEFAPGRQPVLLRCQTVRVPAKQPMAVALAEVRSLQFQVVTKCHDLTSFFLQTLLQLPPVRP